MKSGSKRNVILDLILLVVMLAVFCIKGQFHKPLAFTIGILVALHILWHGKQYRAMARENWKNRNVILDLLMFLSMLSLFFSKGEAHEVLAFATGILTLVHLVWHWKQFKAMYCLLIPQTIYRYVVGTLTAAVLAAVLTAPWFLTIEEHGLHGGPPGQTPGERHHR